MEKNNLIKIQNSRIAQKTKEGISYSSMDRHKCSSCFTSFVKYQPGSGHFIQKKESSMALRHHLIYSNCGKSLLSKETTKPKIPQNFTTIKKPENQKTVIFCQKPPSLPVENSKHKISQRIIGITKPQTSTLSAEKNKNRKTLSDVSKSKTVICCQKPPSLPVENLNPNIFQTLPNPKQSN